MQKYIDKQQNRLTIVECRPDVYRYMNTETGELSGGTFDGSRLKAAVNYLKTLEKTQHESE